MKVRSPDGVAIANLAFLESTRSYDVKGKVIQVMVYSGSIPSFIILFCNLQNLFINPSPELFDHSFFLELVHDAGLNLVPTLNRLS